MEQNQINGRIPPSTSSPAATRSPSLQPNYGSRAVQEALERLASADLIELCGEAKVERCRATRDLRSCGRYVHYVLNSCGHASLCSECSQRCDLCPICRIPLPKTGNRLRPRLYYECIQAGLISKRYDERFLEKDDGDDQLAADVLRLYSLFDVAIENNLASLICHYVTDVCMDESAVSSDPVIAFLLDEVVVKDWCKKTFRSIVEELQEIYTLRTDEMRSRLNRLFKISTHLAGISNVLEVLESSFKGSLMAKLHDLQFLQESILKTRQHMEAMMWCIRHQFLENVRSVHTDLTSWRSVVHERKSASIKRSWPEVISQPAESSMQAGSLFIEDALTNIEAELEDTQDIGGESDLASFERSFLGSKLEGLVGCYPFDNLRVAVDLLFLHGCSDMVVAKQAILLYYLFDRHWTVPDDSWRSIVDDFVAAFGITRRSMLESLTFYLLDDHTDEALQVACEFLPEISGPSTHPKVAQVLLERELPEMALMVLRLSARDGSDLITLNEAVTAVRVRVECGLLTEAFMHQRMLCSKVKEKKWKVGPLGETTNDSKGKCRAWEEWLELLVFEICCLCIKSNLVDRMIELPWNLDEEKYIYKCLLDFAVHDPSTTSGSLLVVYYLQRYRYAEAYQVDLKLQALEQEFISKNTLSEEVSSRMRSTSHWRAGLVVHSIGLLPQDQQQLIKSGQLRSEIHDNSGEVVEISAKSDPAILQEPESIILLAPQSDGSSLSLRNKLTLLREASGTPSKLDGSISNSRFEIGINSSASILHERLLANVPKPEVGNYKSGKYDGILTSRTQHCDLVNDNPRKKINRTSLNLIYNSPMDQHQRDKSSVETEQIGFATQYRNTGSPYTRRVTAEPVSLSHSKQGLQNDYGVMAHSHLHDKSEMFYTGDDPMDISWRENDLVVDGKRIVNGGPRWRSDETSDGDEDHVPDRVGGTSSFATPSSGTASFATPSREKRRIRFARR